MRYLLRAFVYDLRLRSPKWNLPTGQIVQFMRDFLVKSYQQMGILALLAVFLLIMGYFMLVGFFFFNRNWSVPFILNPHSEKVLSIRKEAIKTESEMDLLRNKKQTTAERIQLLKSQMLNNEKNIGDLMAFFRQDREEKVSTLKRMELLHRQYKDFAQIFAEKGEGGNDASKGLKKIKEKIQQDFKHKLLSFDQYWQMQNNLWQKQNGKIDFELKLIEIEGRISQLQKDIISLDRIVDRPLPVNKEEVAHKSGVSYPVLLLKKEQEIFVLENQRIIGEIKGLESELVSTESSFSQLEDFKKALDQSPYVKAFNQNVVMGFVPYDNIDRIKSGGPIFGCRFKIFWCEKTGTVVKVLDGEVTQNHPFFPRELRGKIIEMKLSQDHLAEGELLHINRPPAFLVF